MQNSKFSPIWQQDLMFVIKDYIILVYSMKVRSNFAENKSCIITAECAVNYAWISSPWRVIISSTVCDSSIKWWFT